mgnify:CR=1 FL=1
MPAKRSTADRLRVWIERGLKAGGHPQLELIIRAGRQQTPPIGWAVLAADITTRSGEAVSYESLRQWYGHLDPKPEAVAE